MKILLQKISHACQRDCLVLYQKLALHKIIAFKILNRRPMQTVTIKVPVVNPLESKESRIQRKHILNEKRQRLNASSSTKSVLSDISNLNSHANPKIQVSATGTSRDYTASPPVSTLLNSNREGSVSNSYGLSNLSRKEIHFPRKQKRSSTRDQQKSNYSQYSTIETQSNHSKRFRNLPISQSNNSEEVPISTRTRSLNEGDLDVTEITNMSQQTALFHAVYLIQQPHLWTVQYAMALK